MPVMAVYCKQCHLQYKENIKRTNFNMCSIFKPIHQISKEPHTLFRVKSYLMKSLKPAVFEVTPLLTKINSSHCWINSVKPIDSVVLVTLVSRQQKIWVVFFSSIITLSHHTYQCRMCRGVLLSLIMSKRHNVSDILTKICLLRLVNRECNSISYSDYTICKMWYGHQRRY